MGKNNAEGAQGMTADGPTNKFNFEGEPSNPNIDPRQNLELTTGEGPLAERPGFGDTTLKHAEMPNYPRW